MSLDPATLARLREVAPELFAEVNIAIEWRDGRAAVHDREELDDLLPADRDALLVGRMQAWIAKRCQYVDTSIEQRDGTMAVKLLLNDGKTWWHGDLRPEWLPPVQALAHAVIALAEREEDKQCQ